MNTEKLMKSATVIDRILKILQGFMIAGVIVAAIFIPLTAILGEKVIASATTIRAGHLSIQMTGDFVQYLDLSGIKTSIIVTLCSSIVICAVGWYFLKLLRGILVPMKEGRPFDEGISAKIRKLGWTVLIGGGVAETMRAVGEVFELKAYDLSFLKLSPHVVDYSYTFTISLWFVVVALVLFFLSYVFRCGEALQKEADETL